MDKQITSSKVDPIAAPCAVLCRLAEILGGKWTLSVLFAVAEGTERFSAIETLLPGITPRMLSARLKHLVMFGFIERAGSEHHAVYRLTAEAKELVKLVEKFERWGEKHVTRSLA